MNYHFSYYKKIKMIVLTVLLVLMQIYEPVSGSCGPGPNVTFSCTVGPVHVDWYTPCYQTDCKALWRCTNGTAHHYEESSRWTCRTRGFDFEIPWEHYFCSITVFYRFDNETTGSDEFSANTTKSCSNNSIQVSNTDSFEVGEAHEVNCTVYAMNSGNVSISWTGPNGSITVSEDSRISVLSSNAVSSNGYIHTRTLQFSHIGEEDKNTAYNCYASISGESKLLSKSFKLTNLTIPPPIVSMWALDSNPIIGKPLEMECNVTVAKGVNGVIVIWKANETNIDRVNDTNLDRVNYTLMDTYTIPSLQLEDNYTVYYCEAMIIEREYVKSSANITVSDISLVQPIVSVTELNSPTVNESLLMECNVTLARGIVGNVVISWKANNTANKVTIEEISPEQLLYTDYYETVPLELSHNNTVYHCEAVVNNSTLLTNSTSIIIKLPTTNDTNSDTKATLPTDNIEDISTSSSAAIIMSFIVAVVAGGLAVGLIVYVIFKGKKYIKFPSSNSQDDYGSAVCPVDDVYTVPYRGETSTINFEYLKNNDKVKKWLEMPALDEECSSICSPSITNEIMLDCVVNGHHRKNITISTHDTDYCTGTDNFKLTKNDNGYCSGSSESVSQENGSYISEKAAFSRNAKGKIQNCHLDNVIEEEELIQSSKPQNRVSFPIPDGYVSLEDQNCSPENAVEITSSKQADNFSQNTASSYSPLSSAEEENKNEESLIPSEGHHVPHVTPEIQLTSNSLISHTSTEENCENVTSPTISEGEYLPYTAAVNLPDPAAVTTPLDSNHHMQQNHTTRISNAVSMTAVKQPKQETITAEKFSNVDGDQSQTISHTNAAADTTSINGYDKIQVADVKPYLGGSSSEILPSATMEGQYKFAYCTINGDQQSIKNDTDVYKFDGDPYMQIP